CLSAPGDGICDQQGNKECGNHASDSVAHGLAFIGQVGEWHRNGDKEPQQRYHGYGDEGEDAHLSICVGRRLRLKLVVRIDRRVNAGSRRVNRCGCSSYGRGLRRSRSGRSWRWWYSLHVGGREGPSTGCAGQSVVRTLCSASRTERKAPLGSALRLSP